MSCDNGVIDGDETDVDCGGSCAPCETLGANCSINLDCYYHWCRPTRPVPTCGVPVKQCLNNCTEAEGHGYCTYFDVTGGKVRREDCTLDQWSCTAQCACREGWFGDDCSLTPEQWAEVILLRNAMMDSLGDAGEMQDAGPDAFNQQAGSLSSMTSDPGQLAGGGELAALDLVGGIAGGSASHGISSGTDAAIGGTLSSLLSSSLLSNNRSTFNASM